MTDYREYWDKNIENWAKFYLDISHGDEKLYAPGWLGSLYNGTIARHEAQLMRERFSLTLAFMDKHVKPGMVFADIGCGTGIFVVEALKRGASVQAIDFSKRALEVTKTNVERHAPGGKVEYHQADIQVDTLPTSDVAIMVGVAPYLADIDKALDRVLSSTGLLFGHFVDPDHWANRLRRVVPMLNVRRLIFHDRREVDACYASHDFVLEDRKSFATGYMDVARARSRT